MDEARAAEAWAFGERLRVAREQHGWDVPQLAARVGTGTPRLRDRLAELEEGWGSLPREVEATLAEVLELPLDIVQAGAEACRGIKHRPRHERVDTRQGLWVTAPLLSRYALLLLACREHVLRVPQWADGIVPFAIFGRLFAGPAGPPLTLGELLQKWANGALADVLPGRAVPRLIVGATGGYLNYTGHYGFLPGEPVRLCSRSRERWPSGRPFPAPSPWPISPDAFAAVADRVAALAGRAGGDQLPWTLRRLLGPDGLDLDRAASPACRPTDDLGGVEGGQRAGSQGELPAGPQPGDALRSSVGPQSGDALPSSVGRSPGDVP